MSFYMQFKIYKHLLLSIIACLAIVPLHAQIKFVENKGQMSANVAFYADLPDGKVYLEKNGMTFVFYNGTRSHGPSHTEAPSEPRTLSQEVALLPVKWKKQKQERKGHAYKIVFEGADRKSTVKGVDKDDVYSVYYHTSRVTNTKACAYNAVVYENIYPNVDLKVYSNNQNLKYDFIVKPHADPSQVKLKVIGADSLAINDGGGMMVETSINTINELKPYAYQDTLENQIPCELTLEGNVFAYKIGAYDPWKELIIDPELIFSTYSGSQDDNWGFTAAYDSKGNVYSVGVVGGDSFIQTVGAFEENHQGGHDSGYDDPWDVSIIKYTPDGTERIWAAFLGGSGEEFPSSIICNSRDELLVLGATGSDDFPAINAIQSHFAGGTATYYGASFYFPNGTDIFLTRISEDGSMILNSTYIGGSGNDGLNYDMYTSSSVLGGWGIHYNYGDASRGEVSVDQNDDIYIASNTHSDNFPTGNIFNGARDGVLLKLDREMTSIEWGKYVGGTGNDALYSIAIADNGDVYATGGTESFSETYADAYQPNWGGNVDGYLAKFNQEGEKVAETFYGSSNYDQIYFVRTDTANDVYVYGQTENTSGFFNTPGRYQEANAGQFVSKFSNNLQERLWSTTFGSDEGVVNIAPTAFQVDDCKRIYISGFGRAFPYDHRIQVQTAVDIFDGDSIVGVAYENLVTHNTSYDWGTIGMDVTADAYRSESYGQDFYFMVLKPDALALEYATFFGEIPFKKYIMENGIPTEYGGCARAGENHVDGGTSRFDKKGNIYQAVCASCGACDQFPTYPLADHERPAWSNTNNSGNCNNAVIRFFFESPVMVPEFSWETVQCFADSVIFQNNSQTKGFGDLLTYAWDFGDGNKSSAFSPTHKYKDEGRYRVVLTIVDELSCNYVDSLVKFVDVTDDGGVIALRNAEMCVGDTAVIGPDKDFGPGAVFEWEDNGFINNTSIQNPKAFPEGKMFYNLIVQDELGCVWQYQQRVEPVDLEEEISFDIRLEGATADNLVCSNEEVSVVVDGNVSSIMYEWSFDPDFDVLFRNDIDDTVHTYTPTADAVIYVRAEHAFCESNTHIESIPVNYDPYDFILTADNSIVCINGESYITLTGLTEDTGNSYDWDVKGEGAIVEFIDGETVIKTVNNGDTEYLVSVETRRGCVKKDSVFISVDSLHINGHTINITCKGDADGEIVLNADGVAPYEFEWSNGVTERENINLSAGFYSVSVTDDKGCKNDAQFVIYEPEELVVEYDVKNTLCEGSCHGILSTEISGGWKPYNITIDDSIMVTTAYDSLCVGWHAFVVTDSLGCSRQFSFNIADDMIFPELNAWAEDSILLKTQSTILHVEEISGADEPFEIVWEPDSSLNSAFVLDPVSLPDTSTQYIVTLKDKWGCESTDTVFVRLSDVYCYDPFVFVPTAFTPNDDGKNDYIQVKSVMLEELHFVIYDRLGEKVFETEELDHRWEGDYRGQELEPQVFVYYLKAYCVGGEVFEGKGNITLIR